MFLYINMSTCNSACINNESHIKISPLYRGGSNHEQSWIWASTIRFTALVDFHHHHHHHHHHHCCLTIRNHKTVINQTYHQQNHLCQKPSPTPTCIVPILPTWSLGQVFGISGVWKIICKYIPAVRWWKKHF